MTLQKKHASQHVPGRASARNGFTALAVSLAGTARRMRGVLAMAAVLLGAVVGVQAQAVVFPNTNVGTPSAQQSFSITVTGSGPVSAVKVVTSGLQTGSEFTEGTASCTGATGATCTESVIFTPAYPGVRLGSVVLLNVSNQVIGTEYLSGVGLGGLDVLSPGYQLTVAGAFGQRTGSSGSGDNGPATSANFSNPTDVVVDGAGNLYIADSGDSEVRMVCFSSSSATIAGVTCPGAGIIINLAPSLPLSTPSGLGLDGAGNLYITDSTAQVVIKITAATGLSAIVAGDGTKGYRPTDDGGPATSAELWTPSGVTVDASGNLFIADTNNNRIRRVDAITGIITTVAGGGTGTGSLATDAILSQPYAVAFDAAGNMYIPDSGNNIIREVANVGGIITPASTIGTVAGMGTAGDGCVVGDASKPSTIELNTPEGVAVDPAGNLYIADSKGACVLKTNTVSGGIISLAAPGNFTMTPLAPTGTPGLTEVKWPQGIFVDKTGNVYYADWSGYAIEEVQSNLAVLDFLPTVVLEGEDSAPIPQNVENDGNVTSLLDNISALSANNAALDGPTTNCDPTTPTPHSIVEDVYCTIGAVFAPSTTGTLEGNIYVTGNTANDNGTTAQRLDIMFFGRAATFTLTLTANGTTPTLTVPYGTSVALLATLGGGTTSGTIQFTDSVNGGATTVLGTVSVASDAATLTEPALVVGVHTITGTFSGDSFPATVTVIVQEATTTALTSATNPSVLGNTVVLTATISGTAGGGQTLGGTVTFTNSTSGKSTAVTIGAPGTTDTVNFTAPASFFVQGANVITAVYAPTTSSPALILGSTSASLSQDVQAPTSTIVTSTPNPSTYGTAVTFTATVTPTGTGTATGVVNFYDGATLLGSGSLIGTTDVATYTTTATQLNGGVHSTITAAYRGDLNNAPSTSPDFTQTVNQATPTITWATPAPIGYGTRLSATQLDASSGGAPGSLAYTPVSGTLLPVGSYTLSVTFTPTYPANYKSATQTVTLVVTPPPTLSVTSSGSPSLFGSPVTFTATISSGPTGTLTFYDGTKAIGTGTLSGTTATFTTSTLAVGAHTITADWAGNSEYAAVTSAAITQTVNVTQTATTVAATPNPGIAGAPVALTATVKVTAGAATPTGTVTFTDGTTALGTATLSAAGTATINPTLVAGSHSIVATYNGDTDDGGSASAVLTLQVNLATTSASVSASPNPAAVLSTITFTATVTGTGGTPTGTVSFLANGTINLGTGTLNSAGTAQVTNATLAAGTYSITAVYLGDANNAGSTSAAIKEVVNTLPTTTDLGSAATTGSNSQLILVATVVDTSGAGPVPTGTVTFTSGTTVIGTATLDTSGIATLTPNLNVGMYTIVASYGGDAQHSPSQSIAVPISSQGSAYNLTVTPSTISLASSQNTNVTVTLTSVSGFTDTIGLGCASLPAGVNCHFSSLTVPLSASMPATAQLTIDTNNPLGGGATAMNRPAEQRRTALAGLFLPFSLLMGWVLWRFRKRHAGVLSMVLVLLLSGAALMATGCGGFTQNTAAPGTYTFQVVGVGQNSNVTEYQNVTLTITK